MPMRIACDVDDVVCQFNGFLLARINREFGTKLDIEDITHWAWWNDGSCPIKFPEGSVWKWLEKYPSIWAVVPPFEGALEGLEKLWNDGHWLELITSKPDWAKDSTWQWLATNKPMTHGVIMVPSGVDTGNKETWTKFGAVGERFDLIIDDKPATILEWSEKKKQVIIFDRPWNRYLDDSKYRHRAKNWYEVLQKVDWLDKVMVGFES